MPRPEECEACFGYINNLTSQNSFRQNLARSLYTIFVQLRAIVSIALFLSFTADILGSTSCEIQDFTYFNQLTDLALNVSAMPLQN